METNVATTAINSNVANQEGTGVTKSVSKSAIYIGLISISQYQKEGTKTAQLRQDITTVASYPTKRIDNDMQDNLFSANDFGFEMKDFQTVEQRVAFMDIPQNATQQDLQAKLNECKDACLYKVMSNRPILTESQKYAISQNIRTMDEFAESQVVRYPEGTTDSFNNNIGGKIVLDKNGKVQYRKVFFSAKSKQDMDLRNSDKEDMYITPSIAAELGIVSSEQKVI